MATTLPRIQVTLTPEVQEAMAVAEQMWPGSYRSELATRLILRGREALADAGVEQRDRRRQAIADALGSVHDAYPEGYLEQLREDWPE